MSTFLSKLVPTSKSIQKEYTEKRQRLLYANDPAKTARVQAKMEELIARKNMGVGDWHAFYLSMHRALQESDLTVNFDARKWFLQENNYATYTQMYERASSGGRMALKDDSLNPAMARAIVDDVVTLPEAWANGHPFSQRKRIYKALSMTGETGQAGARHAASGQNPAGKLVGDGANGYDTTNRKFKPKAKQVFAALNFGRRPHGSSTTYGFSHLVLRPSLKENAFYYPADTFFITKAATNSQAAFNIIGAVIEHAPHDMEDALWKSCVLGQTLADTNSVYELMEAHIFKTVKMDKDVKALVLSRQNQSSDPAYSDVEWKTIQDNALWWCARNKVKMLMASP